MTTRLNERTNPQTIAPYPFQGGDPVTVWESPKHKVVTPLDVGSGRYPFMGGDPLQEWEKRSRSHAPYPGGDPGDD